MGRFAAWLLICTTVATACAADESKPAIPGIESGDTERAVSPEGAAYLEKLRKNTPFGTNSFDMKGLRAGMGTRIEPTIKDVKLIKVKVGE
ncbi:MAG: hypothetical protein IAF94_24885, partial [Pirellulaceae bacterium]|nr:hypothetical protein [Pirellulaceae bacterium]